MRIILIIFFIEVFAITVSAQDIHFSQFYAMPLLLNPAKTGFFDGSYRFSAIYRNQWKSVSVPYNTVSGSADFSLATGTEKKDLFGIGLVAFSDRAGDSHFTTSTVEGSLAFNKCLDRYGHNYLGAGLQAGYINSYLDYQALNFDEDFEGGSTTESFVSNSSGYPDVSAGVEWNYLSQKQKSLNLGVSVFHANEPIQTFMNDGSSIVYRKIVFNSGASFPFSAKFSLYPKMNYTVQGTQREFVFGAFGRFGVERKQSNEHAFYLGALNRMNDAIIFLSRYDINNFAFAFSYDFNYSSLREVSHGMGGPELSIQYIGSFINAKKKKVYCPKL